MDLDGEDLGRLPGIDHPKYSLTVYMQRKEGRAVQVPCAMVPWAQWHTEDFKMKEFEKWHLQEVFSELLLKHVIRPSCERYSFYIPRKKKHIYLQKLMDTKKESKQKVFPTPYSTLSSYSLCHVHSPSTHTQHSTQV